MYAKHGAVPVAFEVGRLSAKGGHAHVQVVPVPNKLGGRVEEFFQSEARAQGIEWEADPDEALRQCSGGRGGRGLGTGRIAGGAQRSGKMLRRDCGGGVRGCASATARR